MYAPEFLWTIDLHHNVSDVDTFPLFHYFTVLSKV